MDKPFTVEDPTEAFEQFKQAMKQILTVPKEELKRREEEWKKERKQKKSR